MYQSQHSACEALRLLDPPGTKDAGRLYRIAMEKKGIFGKGGVPIGLKIPGKRNTRGIVYKFLDEVLVECITRLKSMGRLGGVQVHRWRRWRIRISENYLRDCTIFDDMEINEAGQVHNSCLHPVCILCTIISSIHPAKPSIIPLI